MDIDLYLKQKKIKVTNARKNILEIFSNSKCFISADYIYLELKKRGLRIDLSTVYRNLYLLDQKGILDKFDLGDGKYNYILKERSHKHIIECDLCHKEIEFECPVPQIEEIIKVKTGITLIESNVSFKGICKECDKIK